MNVSKVRMNRYRYIGIDVKMCPVSCCKKETTEETVLYSTGHVLNFAHIRFGIQRVGIETVRDHEWIS